ncbi:MAG TPA: DNA-directed RNA polymerase subunit D [Thermoprotei archaeon]|nr:DNA-directed RNA polymerase subunit D [Thermoprotei archaeon]
MTASAGQKAPSLSVISKQGTEYKLLIDGVSVALANSIRRALVAYVPTLAIDEALFAENNTSFYREYIAHRLSLIPIKTDLSYEELADNFFEPKREVSMVLDVKSDGNMTVYASELKFPDGQVATTHPKIPIISMVKGQSLRVELTARMGTGRQHAKWQPVSAATSINYPMINIMNESCGDCKKCVDACPTGALGLVDGKLKVIDPLACTLCEACEEACPGVLEVKSYPNRFVLSFEVNGQLDARTALMAALEILNRGLRSILSQLEVLAYEKKSD